MTKNQQGYYINSLSSIPMFEQGKLTGKNYYNTSYHQDYPKKQKFLDMQKNFQKNTDFSTYDSSQNYDYMGLSARLKEKSKNQSNLRDEYKGQFESKSLNNLNTETRYQYNATGQIYKRPQIPDYTKRDNFFQTNQEKNIAYVQTADGKLMPFVPSDPDLAVKKAKVTKKGVYSDKMPEHERFYKDKLSEADEQFTKKNQVFSSIVMPNSELRNTNSNKNVGYIKTSSGSIITFVPFSENTPALPAHLSPRIKPRDPSPPPQVPLPYDGNHLKIKLHNPMNQLRRNQSHISQFFS